jgi:hypothetical protein
VSWQFSAWNNRRLTVLDEHIAHVPKDKRHRPPRLCICFFGIIPRIPVPINSTSAVAIDVYPLSSDNEPSVVILEGNGIGVVSPVAEIV